MLASVAFVTKITRVVICNWYHILLHDRFTKTKYQNKFYNK